MAGLCGFSLGMSQRLGVAVAMLGNPEILLLDEPVNGLDPEGVRWIRNLMKSLAAEGRTVRIRRSQYGGGQREHLMTATAPVTRGPRPGTSGSWPTRS